ncbi:AAA family ATPase [Streptomyces sp. NPDC058548]|uniref:helix-turn-helix transcriptional regulator n=1 Tax=Streptomyces sp. NPDC058548 TaxID=3346545 RepID=UPI003647871A
MLIERDSETRRVREALRAAAAGGGSPLLLLSGPLGIGRSAWLREIAAVHADQDVHVLRAHAAPMEQDFAFGVVRQLFDSLISGLSRNDREALLQHAGTARPVFGDDGCLPADTDTGPAPGAVLHGLRALLARLGADRPLLLLVDDVQWADDWSLRWLAYLARRPHGLRAVTVCALREGEPRTRDPLVRDVADAATEVMGLAPLSEAAVAEVVREQFGRPGDPEFLRACHETSGGNPMFLMSVVLGLAAGDHAPTADQADTARSLRPSRLRERLAACLTAQTRHVRDVVSALAALGERGTPDLVRRLAGLDSIGFTASVKALRQLGLLADGEPLRFVHRVVQDAAEASLTLAEHQRWHEAAADLLYRSGCPAEQVAAQLMAAPAVAEPWCASVLRTAADTALYRGAPDTAARYLRHALLDMGEDEQERARLLVHLATAERHFDEAAAERHVAQAMSLLDTAAERAAAALCLSAGLPGTTSAPSLDLIRRAADELGPHSRLTGRTRELALRLEARLRYSGREDPAELALAVRQLRDAPEGLPVCSAAERERLAALLYSATLGGGLPAAEVARQAERVLEREPAGRAGGNATAPLALATLVAADKVDEIEPWIGTDEATGPGTVPAEQSRDAAHALLLLARGRLAGAAERAQRALGPAEADSRESAAVAGAVLAAVALETRDPALSERIRGRALARRPLGFGATMMLRLLEAAADARCGRPERALDTVLAVGRRLEAAGWRNPVLFPWRPRAIALLARLGDGRAARALAEEEYRQALGWGAPVALGRAQRLRAGLRQGSEAVVLLRDAVDVLRGSANELELARALRALGLALGDDGEADALLREASGLAVRCGVPWPGDRPGTRAAEAPGGPPEASLTPTETRVAAMACSGLTNHEIATELNVGSRVVEKHLTNSYRKLGITGRRELVALLGGGGPSGGR